MSENMKLFSDTENMRSRVRHAYEKIKWFVPEDVRHGRLLDIGCGTGNGVIAALQHDAMLAIGVDRNFDEFGHEYDVREFPELCIAMGVDPKKALLLEANIFESRFAPQSFDYAIMLDSLEHVPTPERFIKYAYECLRGGGGVFLIDTCPLYYSPVGHHLFQWFPADTDPWAHLRLGFEERCHNAGIDSWSMDKFRELNKVTCGEVISMVTSAGFIIEQAHYGKPTDESMDLYAHFRNSFDPAIIFDEQWLFEDWVSILARKP